MPPYSKQGENWKLNAVYFDSTMSLNISDQNPPSVFSFLELQEFEPILSLSYFMGTDIKYLFAPYKCHIWMRQSLQNTQHSTWHTVFAQ